MAFVVPGGDLVKGSSSFLKKGTKKPLRIRAEAFRERPKPNLQKFFASFFQKRRSFRLFCGTQNG
jgi:hypothetical protein